jgi:hypothetical protein
MGPSAACRTAIVALSLLAIPGYSQTPPPPDSMWSLLDEILKQPADKASLQALYGAAPVSSNEQYGVKYLWPQAISFADGLQVQQATLIATRDPQHNSVGFAVTGRCVKLPDIESHYPDTRLSAMPTHGYPDAAVTYRTESQGRKVQFFLNYFSRCLVNVTIRSD